jgi:sugar O-acyltransferase (sialic acid O-acetyltransferase NeuD family)
MVIAGAKGFAKEVCEVLLQLNYSNPVAFFDNVSMDAPDYLFDQYPVLQNETQLKAFLQQHGTAFVLGVGNPLVRYKMAALLTAAGGTMEKMISPFAQVGILGTTVMDGCSIMTGTVITSEVTISEGVLINLNCTVGHNVSIGRYSELSPGVHVSGNTSIGEFSVLGTGVVVIPNVNIGNNVIVAAGSVVTKDVPDNVMVAGVPAVVKKELPLNK